MSPGRSEQLLPHGIIDGAVFESAFVHQPDRNAEHREAVQVVGRSIERIDDPQIVGVALLAAFLSENGVLGIVSLNHGYDRFLGIAVCFADEIVAALYLNLELFEFVEIAEKCVSSAPRSHDCHIKHCFHVMIPPV